MLRLVFIFSILLNSSLFSQSFNWSIQVSPISTGLNDVFFIDNQTGWICGVNGEILHTADGGLVWQQQISGTTVPFNTIFFVNNQMGWVAGGSNNAEILFTSNGGQNWSSIGLGINTGPILDIVFDTKGDTGWAITQDSIYFSFDQGQHWMAESYSGVIGTAVNKTLYFRNTKQVFVGGRRFQTGIQDSRPEIYNRKLEAGNYVWGPTTQNQFALMDRIESISFTPNLVGFAGGIQGKVYKMDPVLPDITGPWNINLDLGGGNNQTITGMAFVDNRNGMFGTPFQQGPNAFTLIYHTIDTGNSWGIIDTIPAFSLNSLVFIDQNHAFAVGGNGIIYKGVSSSIGQSEIEKWIILKSYQDELEILLPTDKLPGKLRIFDLKGQILKAYLLSKESSRCRIPLNQAVVLVFELSNGEIFWRKIMVASQ